MNGSWTKVSSVTEIVENPNPRVWYEAARNAKTYEEALYFYDKAEDYYEKDPHGYHREWGLKADLYCKFHAKSVVTLFWSVVVVVVVFPLLAFFAGNPNSSGQRETERIASRASAKSYLSGKNRKQMDEREIQQKIREKLELESRQAAKDIEEKKARENANQNANAERTFLSFHKAITDRRLRDAYNILSPDYQRFVGSYEKFTPGYDTTISSEIVEIQKISEDANTALFSYKLKAVDRDGNGRMIRFFVGKAKLINIDGDWRLDSTEAKFLPTNNVATVIAKGDVNLRATPTTNANSVGYVHEGDQIEIIETGKCNDASAAIITNDNVSYNDGKKTTPLFKGMAVKIVGEGNGYYDVLLTVNGRTDRVRTEPRFFTKLHGTTWYKVRGKGYTGWIYSNYVRKK